MLNSWQVLCSGGTVLDVVPCGRREDGGRAGGPPREGCPERLGSGGEPPAQWVEGGVGRSH